MPQRRRRFLTTCAVSLLGPQALAALAAPPAVQVEIRDYKFLPDKLAIKAGTTVRWINQEKRTTHSILFTGAAGFESERMFPGESWERRFEQPGSYPYSCGPHPEMKGLVEVAP